MEEIVKELLARIKKKDMYDDMHANARAKANYVSKIKRGDWYVYVPEYEEELKLKNRKRRNNL